jgi:hypothetical protein
MKFIQKYGLIILIVLSFLALLNGCGANVKISALQKQVDSLKTQIVTKDQMIDILKTTPSIETLRLQELAAKKNQPIINIINDKKK